MVTRHSFAGHTAIACTHPTAHAVVGDYRSASAADRHAAQTAPEGRRFEVRDNHADPDKATALEVWCVPVGVRADELAGRELAKSTGRDWLTLTTIERADFIRMAAAEDPIREARKHAEKTAADLLTAAQSKLTAAEFAAIVNAAKADAYRDVRREMVWKTEAYKAMQVEMVQLSDDLADKVTACGGHYQQPSLTPRFPEGTPEYAEYATKLRTALAEPGAFDFLMEI